MARPQAAIVGVAESDLGRTPDKTVLQLQHQAASAALADAGLGFGDVDALFCAGDWAWAPNLMLAEYLGIRPKYTDSTNIGGSSFEAHLGHAVAGIEAGLFEVALITYGSTQRSEHSRGRGGSTFKLTEQFEPVFGLPTPVGAYALAAMRHMHEYGTTSEQLAEVAVATRKWAAMNEKAMMRDPISIEDVLNSRWVAEPLHLLDCCLVTDGGGAVVVTTAERARNTHARRRSGYLVTARRILTIASPICLTWLPTRQRWLRGVMPSRWPDSHPPKSMWPRSTIHLRLRS